MATTNQYHPPATPIGRQVPLRGFMDLPPELRIKVYIYLFVGQDGGPGFSLRSPYLMIPGTIPMTSQFLCCSMTIRDEGTLILYGENKFEAGHA